MDKKTRADRDYDGVIYEPSDYIEPRRKPSQAKRKSQPRSSPKRKSSRSQFTIFYILTLFAAVILCIVIFLVVFNSASKRPNEVSKPPETNSDPVLATDNAVAIEEMTLILGFIQEVDPAIHQVRVLDIENGVVITLSADVKTTLTSRYGQTMLFSEFRAGDVVEVSFVTRTNVLKSMALSSESWEYKQVKDIKIDAVEQTLSYSNEKYKFGKGMLVRYKDEPYDIADIKPIDICTIRGYKDTVWAVDVIRSHGTMILIGKEDIVDGLLEVNTDIFTTLEAFETLDVVEGEHRLVIKGSNVEPFVKLVTINPGEVTTVDLAEAQLKSGVLRLNVNEQEYTLTVNGEVKSTDEPIVLPYGVYELRVEKEDFEPWNGQVNISSPTVDVDVTLQEIFKLARLAIITEPAGADIYVDNNLVGTSPLEVPVEMGVHTITPRLDGYVSITIPVTVETARYETIIELQPRNDISE